VSEAVIREGLSAWRVTPADEVSVLVDAEAYYRSFCSAALRARRYIYIAGWQFDTQARLLRPDPAAPPAHPIELLPFLNFLCEATLDLHIYIAAWDYSLVYAIEREWLQKVKFAFQSHPRVHFEFTNHPDPGGCYHRKIVIVDDAVAFLGGLDLCDSRWDTRRHQPNAPERIDLSGRPYKPFHDIQVALRGAAIQPLRDLFVADWRRATGQDPGTPPAPELTSGESEGAEPFVLTTLSGGLGVALRCRRTAISRTECDDAGKHSIAEIQQLFERAIGAAERLIYIETQYFTSRTLAEALCHRLADGARSKL